MSVFKALGPNSKVQYWKCVIDMWENWVNLWSFFSFFFFTFFLIFCFILPFYLLLHTMDELRHKILVVVVFTMAMHWVITQVVELQWVAIGQHWSMMSAMLFFMEFVDMTSKVCNMWRYERAMGYMKNQLLGSFFENMFQQETRLSYDTLRSFIRLVSLSLDWKNAHIKESIHIETRIAMAHHD
jgi:hypothetical protein